METRLTDLEIRLTHQESAIDELTRVVLKQEESIKKLQQDAERLREQVKHFSDIAHISEETPPPHY